MPEPIMVQMDDPTFEAGSSKVATIQFSNPTLKSLTYLIELYLGEDKVSTSGTKSITLNAKQAGSAGLTITMPSVEGTYAVFFDVWVGAALIAHYQATESVVIVISPAVTVTSITW